VASSQWGPDRLACTPDELIAPSWDPEACFAHYRFAGMMAPSGPAFPDRVWILLAHSRYSRMFVQQNRRGIVAVCVIGLFFFRALLAHSYHSEKASHFWFTRCYCYCGLVTPTRQNKIRWTSSRSLLDLGEKSHFVLQACNKTHCYGSQYQVWSYSPNPVWGAGLSLATWKGNTMATACGWHHGEG
jgi:hypothetical protein